ncbi:hypothetical protein ACFWIN_25055 [Streptomyces sp. NPDC127049]|uniref:hypothetical protein n=1 Tax=Streptomyces sp. NPDC127049 TaxID=3347118 RepID=UPI00365D12A8
MSSELVAEVQRLLEQAGYGPGSGLTVDGEGDTVLVGWHVDPLIRPTIAAHAADPDVHAAAEIAGIRTLLDAALTAVLTGGGLSARAHSPGVIAVTRRPVAPTPLAGLHTATPAGGLPLVSRTRRPVARPHRRESP